MRTVQAHTHTHREREKTTAVFSYCGVHTHSKRGLFGSHDATTAVQAKRTLSTLRVYTQMLGDVVVPGRKAGMHETVCQPTLATSVGLPPIPIHSETHTYVGHNPPCGAWLDAGQVRSLCAGCEWAWLDWTHLSAPSRTQAGPSVRTLGQPCWRGMSALHCREE